MTKKRIWTTAAAVVAGVTGAIVLQGIAESPRDSQGPRTGAAQTVSGPVRADVRTTALTVSGDRADLPRRDTEPFSLVGLSWSKPDAGLPGTVEVRTRTKGGAWTGWKPLLTDDHGAGEPESRRGATEPVWVGPSDGVQVRVDGHGSALPAGLRLEMVDPGNETALRADPVAYTADLPDDETTPPADTTSAPQPDPTLTTQPDPTVTTQPSPTDPPSSPEATTTPPLPTAPATPTTPATPTSPTAPPSTAPKPAIVTRAQWGADESLNNEEPGYGTEIKAVFVHHTVDANAYTCAQSAAMVRAIRAYHMQSNGWKDIGYNFLVDKCGTIFEGRKGGVDLPVVGAHNVGFNTNTTGIAVLGEYSSVDASSAAKTAVARIAAWKLGQYGHDPAGKVDLAAGLDNGKFKLGQTASFYRISGHRDGYATECPGTKLYASLPAIRALAGGPVAGLTLKPYTGAGTSGSTAYTRGTVTVNWAITSPSAFVRRFEVLVDGKVAATGAPTATSAPLSLTAGTHTVAVRAVHISGKTSTTPNSKVVAETTPPSFTTKPAAGLRTGTVSTTSVPVTLTWKAIDAAALKEVRLTKPSARTYGPATASAPLTAKPATATTWSLTAYDQAGNSAAASTTATPVILQETGATRTGTWTTKSSSSYLGGKSYSSGTKNASLSWTFTGRSAAWVVSRASGSGQAYVYVDGVKAATVDLRSTATKYRDVQWTKTWAASGKHTVKIVVAGTSGRPTVTTDGLVYLK
ncbi:N-acetylmuramoyl-L-alanine amidase [Streptomyces sp. NPDC046939]|uniref:N-acetylmuramoyl-L-alanine amidase n=1 Tax=Streptomyces sp. NPDC046939 TaxID=3155376 RepID=UPI0033EF5C36